MGANKVGLEWVDDNAVTLWSDGKPLATGHGAGRADAIHDLYTTLRDRGEAEAAKYAARCYFALTKRDVESGT